MNRIPLPIDIKVGDRKLRNVSIKKPTSGVLADTRRAVDVGDSFKALQVFIGGCIDSIEDIADRPAIRSAIANLPYKSAELLIPEISLIGKEDDGIEGIYQCPRCAKQIICEQTEIFDTRDHFRSIPVHRTENEFFTVKFSEPLELHQLEDEPAPVVDSISLVYPTLGHCSAAFNRVGEKDSMRLQFAIYNEALMAVNEVAIDPKFKGRFGMSIFEKMSVEALKNITEAMDAVGLETKSKKTCPSCGKIFEVVLNALSFFASSLQ